MKELRTGWPLLLLMLVVGEVATPGRSQEIRADLSPTSPNFGKILRDNGQSNLPRQIQLGLRFLF